MILLVGILLLALVLRLVGVGHGLPHPYHIDENVIVWLAVASAPGEPAPTFHCPPFFQPGFSGGTGQG